uniref:Laminin, gamma 3 n=1 Tax=Gouania willdenowi TaxID=441366 RepID=A0A8C5G955_GOUWI
MDALFDMTFLLFPLLLSLHFQLVAWAAMDSCYDDEGQPSRCMPKFENIAFNKTVVASNVCGSPTEDYCMQTGSTRSCHKCDASDPDWSHNASFLTDFNRNEEPTWWQSQSMFYGIQHPNSVNLTLHLGKAFEITYIRLKFYTSRPESFAVYKRTEQDGPWLPYQYYSASCGKTYGKDAKRYLHPGDDEKSALCTDEFSDISPLTGGNVAFSTLEGRPSAYNFDQSLMLQEWVTATDLLISLSRLNTFGDEFFKDAKVLRSYFYAISDLSVGGRCKCNGHASECVEGEHGGLVCACQHHTVGADCQKCHPFYQDRPWARATGDSANQCLKCNCSGRSEECVFDVEQYRSTGSGGRCVGCRDNTAGPHCEKCRENHHRRSVEDPCLPCNCNSNGSVGLQCDAEGRCGCRVGVEGVKCDTCQPGFASLGPDGCRPCECDGRGRVHDCSPLDGRCYCKNNVEGQSCDRCRPGFFNLQHMNPAGCQQCFCFGHSVVCSSSNQHQAVNITSDFTEDQDDWVGEFSGGQEHPLLWKEGEVYLLPLDEEDVGFYKAPEKFLGQQAYSYGQPLTITFTSESAELLPDHITLMLQGSGITLLTHLTSQRVLNPKGSFTSPQRTFTIRLHETEQMFTPSLSAFEFQQVLHNLTALKISNAGGNNYTSQLAGVTLTAAFLSSDTPISPPAPWVESCSCPVGFTGQFCERCAAEFTREDPSRGPFSTCVPCNCHQHGTCHPETGECECSHFTAGMTCERCLEGYYGNALMGTSGDCRPCPCPGGGSCVQMANPGQVVCTNCPAGQTGMRCQMCEDGYYGDPLGQSGAARPCVRCDCNGNVDLNAVGICDHITGRCMKCLGHTEGENCQRCQRGFFGDAMNQTLSHKCKPCSCNPAGTAGHVNDCHPLTGNCHCLSHVTGRDCGNCDVGFFDLKPGVGCDMCKCNLIGSSSMACHPITGQCVCRAGVEGRLCESCRVGFFGFSSRGCRACNCDPMGSVSMQCHGNGTCLCRQGFVGYKCDKCEINYFHNRETHQCEECPVCYSLVMKQADKLKTRLQDLEKLLARFDCRGRFGKRQHLLTSPMARLYEHEHQGEDTLPNALEDFLAFQEAREAFIKQFFLLKASSGSLLAQLHDATSSLNCSLSTVEEEEKKKESLDDQNRRLCQGFTETLLRIQASQTQINQATLDLDNMVSPSFMIKTRTLYEAKDIEQLMSEGLATHREMAEHIEAVATKAVGASNQTYHFLMDLLRDNSTEEYIRNLTEHSDLFRLRFSSTHYILYIYIKFCSTCFPVTLYTDMVAEWPKQQIQTNAAMKKEKPLQEKVLTDVRKRVLQIENITKPALEMAKLSSNTSKEAEITADAVAKKSKALLSQAKQTRTASAHLGSHVDLALQQLSEQESLTERANSQLTSGVLNNEGVPLERFDRILNDTALRLSMLRGSVESPTLSSKIQKLLSASNDQRSRLSVIDQDIEEITEERDSLKDIALNLPEA